MRIILLLIAIVYFLVTADKIFYSAETPTDCFLYAVRYCAAVFFMIVVLSLMQSFT